MSKMTFENGVLVVKATENGSNGTGSNGTGGNGRRDPLTPGIANNWSGDFVSATQTMDAIARNVSGLWVSRGCIGWDTFFEALQSSFEKNVDATIGWDQLSLVDDSGELKLSIDSDKENVGGEFSFGEHAKFQVFQQLSNIGKTVLGLPEYIVEDKKTNAVISYLGDVEDRPADSIVDDVETGFVNALAIHRFDKRKACLLNDKSDRQAFVRLRHDNGVASVRSILSDRYAVIDHRFIALCLYELTGDHSYISHFDARRFAATGGEFCNWNVLLHDMIREDKESDFGAMYASSNSEIGNGGCSISPSLYRAICMNGCIWNSIENEQYSFRKVHRGNVDYNELKESIQANLTDAIPLDSMVKAYDQLKELSCGETMLGQVIGYVAKQSLSLSRAERKDFYSSLYLEQTSSAGLTNSASDVVNTLTRYASSADIPLRRKEELERIAGRYVSDWTTKPNAWELITRNAVSFDIAKDMETVSDGKYRGTIDVSATVVA